MMNKILKILAAIGSFFSAIFFVLMKQAKEEQKAEEKRVDDLEENIEAMKESEKAEREIKKENEELIEKMHSGNTLDSFNASLELLQK